MEVVPDVAHVVGSSDGRVGVSSVEAVRGRGRERAREGRIERDRELRGLRALAELAGLGRNAVRLMCELGHVWL